MEIILHDSEVEVLWSDGRDEETSEYVDTGECFTMKR